MSKSSRKAKKKAIARKPVADNNSLPPIQRKRSFKDFKTLADYAKGMVYSISRLRPNPDDPTKTDSATLGTGFLVGRNRMMTCAHCINSFTISAENNPLAHHQDGDIYVFVQRDEFGAYHAAYQIPNIDEQLFVYKDKDTAIFYLADSFYTNSAGDYLKHPDMYLELDTHQHGIGTDMAILGYPFCEIQLDEDQNLNVSEITIRGDKGVINTRSVRENMDVYWSTTAFNPGNSGGPIFDGKTGAVIGMVEGYTAVPMNWMKDVMQVGEFEDNEEETHHHHKLRSFYSFGVASSTLLELAEEHQLASR